MLSDTIYYLFLVPLVVTYRFARGWCRRVLLALAGMLFYFYYAGNVLWLLVALTLGSWALLFGWKSGANPLRTRLTSLAVIVGTVATLLYFKYTGFLLGAIGSGHSAHIVAPLAISFFTFEFVHVAADRLTGKLTSVKLLDYVSFIFFFPTMVAGPIKRYQQFVPCLDSDRASANDYLEGTWRIVLGLFKKLVIADNLNTIIEEIGGPSHTHSKVMLGLAVLLYGFRILCDFAGYSDIAIGSARWFGIRVPENFLYPYRQRNIAEFWRHWHVSLSTWLTDYVFIPIGGSRGSAWRTAANLMVVMLISGLWHGAAWNFVLWGAWHGLMLASHRLYSQLVVNRLPSSITRSRLAHGAAYAVTMIGVWIGWAFFMWPIGELKRITRVG